MFTPIENHPKWPVRTVVTHDGDVGVVTQVWADPSNDTFLSIEGPNFDQDDIIPEGEFTLGGTLVPYAPTLNESAHLKEIRQSYTIRELDIPEGLIPAGWAVIYKQDNVYVAWGLASKQQGEILAVGHKTGISHLASKM